MEEYYFRAWVEKTTDTRFDWAYMETEKEFDSKEPSHNTKEWSDWYDERDKFLDSKMEEWNLNNTNKIRYTKSKEMITNIMVNGAIQRPVRCEILDVMGDVGIKDKNDKKIYKGDICKYYNCIDKDGVGVIHRDYVEWIGGTIRKTNLQTPLYYLQRSQDWEVIGNIYENPELLNN